MESYGVSGNDQIDDTQGILSAIKAGNKHLYFPSGTYLISSTINLPNAIKMEGAPNAIFKAIKRMTVMIKMDKPSHVTENFQIQNIIFDGNQKANNCLAFYKLCYPTPAILRDVKCMNAVESGAIFSACQIAKIDGLESLRNGGNGIEIQGCNAMSLYGVSAYQNKRNGIVISGLKDKGTNYSGGLSIFGLHAEANNHNGIKLMNVTTPVSFFGGWIEGNGGSGVLIADSHANLDGLRISGKLNEANGVYPINIEKNMTSSGSNVVIDNCMVVNNKGSMLDIYDGNKNKSKVIIRNLRKFSFIKEN